MSESSAILIPTKKIEEAKKIRDELDSLIETAEILKNKALMNSIHRAEEDIKAGRITSTSSKKELDNFFKR